MRYLGSKKSSKKAQAVRINGLRGGRPKEVWVSIQWIKGFENLYSISNLGRLRRDRDAKNTYKGRIIKPHVEKHGYLHVTLYHRNNRVSTRIHRLVARAFLCPCPTNYEVNHKDGDKSNNKATNLEYTTHLRNMKHANSLELIYKPGAKLTFEQVQEIRRTYVKKRGAQKQLMEKYGVDRKTVYDIINHKTW